ncbi:MAG TPA: SEL1-like repeat protein [Patescibacteria group bacterium]|nr:SEL1-like repeat protein [Patescibacteria group bacterium]
MAINRELEKLYFADKEERDKLKDDDIEAQEALVQNDIMRLTRAKEILHEIDTTEIWNCQYLALLFQHGDTVKDYEKAHNFAKKAVEMGSNVTKWLYAATLDRLLVAQGKPQKFGT